MDCQLGITIQRVVDGQTSGPLLVIEEFDLDTDADEHDIEDLTMYMRDSLNSWLNEFKEA